MFFLNRMKFRPISSPSGEKCRNFNCQNPQPALETDYKKAIYVPCCDRPECKKVATIQAKEIWQALKKNKNAKAA